MNGRFAVVVRCAALIFLSLVITRQPANAEPHLAVQKGLKCMVCHTSSSGGGKRTAYGNIYAQLELPERTLGKEKSADFWTGELFKYLSVGGDIRGGWNQIDVPGQPKSSETDLEEFLAYVEISPIREHLTIYVDAKLRPNDPVVREQYVRLSTSDGQWAIKGGEFFLPYGLRLQDDDAFIRQVTRINFNTPDTGWELGF